MEKWFCWLLCGHWAAHRGSLCLANTWVRCHSLLLLRAASFPQCPGHQVAGSLVLLPVLDLACPAKGNTSAQGTCHNAGCLQLKQGHGRAMSSPRSEALTRTNPRSTLLQALEWIWHG